MSLQTSAEQRVSDADRGPGGRDRGRRSWCEAPVFQGSKLNHHDFMLTQVRRLVVGGQGPEVPGCPGASPDRSGRRGGAEGRR